MKKPKVLVISRVYPHPGSSGQQMRVRNILISIREHFHITFLTNIYNIKKTDELKYKLKDYVDESIIIPTKYNGFICKILLRIYGSIWSLFKGLKFSNFISSKIDLTLTRVKENLNGKNFDLVIYEYWHSYETIKIFKNIRTPVILDMHNILWKSFETQLRSKKYLPDFIIKHFLKKYKIEEENAWKEFDALITINRIENEYVSKLGLKTLYVPMGIEMSKWSSQRSFNKTKKVGYYGGMSSLHNQRDALVCYNSIMPKVWETSSDIEFWIIGSNPPKSIINLSKEDKRVYVTGYIKDVKSILKNMSVIICPWQGSYGFRSRIIEIMAMSIPIVTSEEAVAGMDILGNTKGVITAKGFDDYASKIDNLLSNKKLNSNYGSENKNFATKNYDFKNTYFHLPNSLLQIINN